MREHLDRAEGDDADLCDGASAFRAFAEQGAALKAWHDAGRAGPRPPGRVRPYQAVDQARWTRWWATPVYRHLFDPDGRPRSLRRMKSF
jgi:hypothetical protein